MPKRRYAQELTAVRPQIYFAAYFAVFEGMVVEIRYGKELPRQFRAGLKEFCKRLYGKRNSDDSGYNEEVQRQKHQI